jgi:hypothetical protein
MQGIHGRLVASEEHDFCHQREVGQGQGIFIFYNYKYTNFIVKHIVRLSLFVSLAYFEFKNLIND